MLERKFTHRQKAAFVLLILIVAFLAYMGFFLALMIDVK